MSLVLDSSATLAWVYADEATEASSDIFDLVIESGAWVPSIWRLEVASVLEMRIRRRLHDAAFRDATLADLALLPIRVDPETNDHAWSATVRLANFHKIPIYDAAYLELAQRRGLPLATLDQDLARAARLERVAVLG